MQVQQNQATVYVPFNVGTHSWEETSKTWTPSYL